MMYGREFFGNNGCFGFGFFPYWHFIIIGVIIVSVVLFMFWKKNKNIQNNDEIINILKEKFVNGEITEEEYLNKKNILSKK